MTYGRWGLRQATARPSLTVSSPDSSAHAPSTEGAQWEDERRASFDSSSTLSSVGQGNAPAADVGGHVSGGRAGCDRAFSAPTLSSAASLQSDASSDGGSSGTPRVHAAAPRDGGLLLPPAAPPPAVVVSCCPAWAARWVAPFNKAQQQHHHHTHARRREGAGRPPNPHHRNNLTWDESACHAIAEGSGGGEDCAGPAARAYAAGVTYRPDAPPRLRSAAVLWEAFAIFSLLLYMVLPLAALALAGAAAAAAAGMLTGSRAAGWAASAAAAVAPVLLPAEPLMWPRFLEFGFLPSIRRYFRFSFTLEDPAALDRGAIWAEYPHAVIPLSQLLAVSLEPRRWPGFRVHSVCASVLYRVPGWRHIVAWLGMRRATRRDFVQLLTRHGSVKVNPGGIAEMYLLDPNRELVKVSGRRGFIKIAVEHGVPVLPVFHFGQSQILCYGPKALESLSRRMRMSMGLVFGRWGLPLARPIPLHMVVGRAVEVRHLPRTHPEFEAAVEEAHMAYKEALRALYYRHRGAYGWGDRPLVII